MSDGRSKTSAQNLIKAREAKKSQYIIYDSDSSDDEDELEMEEEIEIPPPKPAPIKIKKSAVQKAPVKPKTKKIIVDQNKKELDNLNKKMEQMMDLFSKKNHKKEVIDEDPLPVKETNPIPRNLVEQEMTGTIGKRYVKKGKKRIYLRSRKTDIELIKKLINDALAMNNKRPTIQVESSSSTLSPNHELIKSIQDSRFKELLLNKQRDLENDASKKIIDLTKDNEKLKLLALPSIKHEDDVDRPKRFQPLIKEESDQEEDNNNNKVDSEEEDSDIEEGGSYEYTTSKGQKVKVSKEEFDKLFFNEPPTISSEDAKSVIDRINHIESGLTTTTKQQGDLIREILDRELEKAEIDGQHRIDKLRTKKGLLTGIELPKAKTEEEKRYIEEKAEYLEKRVESEINRNQKIEKLLGKTISVSHEMEPLGKYDRGMVTNSFPINPNKIKKEKPSVFDNDSESMIDQQLKNAGIHYNFPSDNNNNKTTTTTTTNSQTIPENPTKKLVNPPSGFTDGGLNHEILMIGNKVVRISTDLQREKNKEKRKQLEEKRQDLIDRKKELEKEKEKRLTGNGNGSKEGLYDYQIDQIMKPYHVKGFKGVFAADEIENIEPDKKMSFIMNLDKSNQPGSHWVAVYIDTDKDKSIEYYDSLCGSPTDDFMRQIKVLIDKIKPDEYLKFKINKVLDQAVNTSTCGWHAIRFLLNRYNGHHWKDSTGWSEIRKSEKVVKGMKKNFVFI
ncbi:hypothetical protein DLAC_05878 [Tieghemostelium lacteum]|uniref:Ubiquitin-like protease family profile domain-containing protein n=1 Tax=Tieghemostelium lacteum TaxID=361077 RepID=A0A151ZGY2_TIELA|nr:hypothetical protein DLAC_05878 [Tieghemostelium lacteum]|eukprot:KYQ93232.1 hypothetical protein DLAC_05878 [Tieghemostelium lacteum]